MIKMHCYSLIHEYASTLKGDAFVFLDCLEPQSSQHLGRYVYMGEKEAEKRD